MQDITNSGDVRASIWVIFAGIRAANELNHNKLITTNTIDCIVPPMGHELCYYESGCVTYIVISARGRIPIPVAQVR